PRRARRADAEGPEAVVRGLLRIRLSHPVRPPGDRAPGRGDRQDPPSSEGRTHPGRRMRGGPPYDRAREARVPGHGPRSIVASLGGGEEGRAQARLKAAVVQGGLRRSPYWQGFRGGVSMFNSFGLFRSPEGGPGGL